MHFPETGITVIKMQLILVALIIIVTVLASSIAFAIIKSNENMKQQHNIKDNFAIGTGIIIPVDDRRHQPLGETIVTVDDRRHQLMYDINLIDNMWADLQNSPESPNVSAESNNNNMADNSTQMFTPINPALTQLFIKTLESISQNESDSNTKLSIQGTIQALENGDANSAIDDLSDIHDKITQQLANLTASTTHK